MTNHQILKAFEIEIGLIDDNVNKPLTADSLYWLNQAVNKFVKTRYNRDLVHNTGYEQNEKRFKDLRGLISSFSYNRPSDTVVVWFNNYMKSSEGYTILDGEDQLQAYTICYFEDLNTFVGHDGYNFFFNWGFVTSLIDKPKDPPRKSVVYKCRGNSIKYIAYANKLVPLDQIIQTFDTYDSLSICYPEDFLFTLNEDVLISDLEGNNKLWTNVFECTADSFMYRITNSLTDFHYKHKKARPIRVRTSTGCQLLTDKNYLISKYTLGYIRKPKPIALGENKDDEYTEFEDSIIHEIIKMAAQMYLENSGNERYKSITQEVLTQE